MKFPNHLILDVNNELVTNSSQYWIHRYFTNFKKDCAIFESFSFHKAFLFRKENLLLNKLIKNQKNYSIIYSLSNSSLFLTDSKKKLYSSLYKPRTKVKSKILHSKNENKLIYNFITNPTLTFDNFFFKRLITNFSFKSDNDRARSNKLWSLFDINFLKKEKMYTKLKYSRVPQYDIVSGGVAALLAGFLGFLISEKFGFELADSGDFYILFMYIVFLFFSSRLFLKIVDSENFSWNIFSLKWLLLFLQTLFILLINNVSKLKR